MQKLELPKEGGDKKVYEKFNNEGGNTIAKEFPALDAETGLFE